MENSNPFALDNQLALVTGGGRGIGLDIAKCLLEAGAKVIITGRNEETLKGAKSGLGEKLNYIVHDISETGTLGKLVAQIENEHGPIDILVNNAGINLKKWALEMTDEEFDKILRTNLNAVFSLTRECGKRMIARKKGSIIMITSMAAYYGLDRVVAYTASKSAVAGMVKALATEFSPQGVRVNAIAPGFIETAMMRKAMDDDPARRNRALGRTPMGVFGKPRDIGLAAVYLSSPAANFVTGVSLPVDGGNSIGF